MVQYLDNNNSGFAAWNANRNAASGDKPKFRLGSFLWWMIIFMGTFWLIRMWSAPNDKPIPADSDIAVVANDNIDLPVREINGDKIKLDVRGLRMSKISLNDYAASSKIDDDTRVTLLGNPSDFAEVGFIATGTTAPDAKTKWTDTDGKMVWRNGDGVVFTRDITVDGYIITVNDTIDNKTKRDLTFAPYARIVRTGHDSETNVDTGAVTNTNSKIRYESWGRLDKNAYAYSTTNGFFGFADQYWQTVAEIKSPDQTMRAKSIGDKYVADSAATGVLVKPGETKLFTTTIYAGPRDQVILDSAATSISGIDGTVDYGWFWFFSRPLLWLLNILNSFVMNYGVAIILLTILLRVLMWPLTRKSYVSSIQMQRMQPELQRIQKLYANDKPRLQMEMMNLYRTHKTSPMSGCLPMLLQIPIFFALYKALLVSVNMRNAHFLWITDLASYDPYFILPILMGLTMWLQQRLQSPQTKTDNKNANDIAASTGRVMKWLPLIFTVMFAIVPAGLVLYWTASNVFGILQTYIIKKQMEKK